MGIISCNGYHRVAATYVLDFFTSLFVLYSSNRHIDMYMCNICDWEHLTGVSALKSLIFREAAQMILVMGNDIDGTSWQVTRHGLCPVPS